MRKRNIQKDIRNVDYQTKYLGRGRLIKKNKVLISVLTTSAFLFPAVFASAESISIDKNNSNPLQVTNYSALLNTDIVEFPKEFNAYTKTKGNTAASAKAAKVDRFVYGNFKDWQLYGSSGDKYSWTDDRQYSTIGGATSKFSTGATTQSGMELIVNSTSETGGMHWQLNLMPNTNYTFTFQNLGKNFLNITNPKIIMTDIETGTILYEKFVDNKLDLTNHKFKTPAVNSDKFAKIDLKILGKMNNQKISGDFYFTADTPVIAVDSENNYKAFYKLSEAPGETVQEILEKNDLVYYDSANNNSRINPNFDSAGGTKVDETTVGKTTKTYTGKVNAEKWGVKSEASNYELVITNDIQLKKDMNDTAAKTKALVDADKGLTQVQKDEQNKKIDAELIKAKKAIDDAKNATDIENAAKLGKVEIEKQYQAGTPIADQKTKAVADIDKVIADTKAKIEADKNLTDEEKNAQKLKVDETGNAAKTEIDKADSADALEKAVETGTKNIQKEYVPGKELEDQKTEAKAALDKVIAETKEAIKNDPTLTDAQKKEQTDAVDKTGELVKKAVDSAEKPNDVKDVLVTGTETIKDEYKPGKTVEDQKTEAKAALDKVIAETKEAIKNDPTLTVEEKQKQTEAVDKVGESAQKALEDATTAESISRAVSKGTEDIKAEHKPGTDVADQKTKALADIDKVILETKEAIKNDPTLTTADKKKQTEAVDEAGKLTKEAINQATTADELNQAVETGTKAIIKEHVPGDGLDVRKETAKDLIDKEVVNTKKAIENDPTLTASEKEKQIQAAVNEGEKAKTAIDAAIDANGIDNETAKGIETVANQHKSGDAVDTRKDDAKKAIDEEAKLIKEKIANDPTLTNEEKTDQAAKVDQEATTAKDAIDAATTADGVDEAKGKGIELIDNQYQPGSSLDGRKDDAKKAIDEEARLIKEKIANDPTLTKEEKELQSGKVDEEATTAKDAIDTAKDASGVDEAKGKGIELIDNQYQPGSSLDGRKESAKKVIDEEATLTKEQIANDPTLTAEEKAEQSGKVDEEATTAKEAIDLAKNADGVDEAKGKGIELIDNQYQPGNPLDSRKEDAKKVIDEEATLIKDRINNDPTLTNEEKAEQSGKVDEEAVKAKATIDEATDASGVDNAKGKGIELIDNQYRTGDSLNSRKKSAKEAIEREAAFTKEQIANDTTLTDAEKAEQINGVDEEATTAKEAIDEATDASGVDSAKGKGIELIDNQYQPGISIVDRKESAKEAIDQEVVQTKDRINNDPTLTDEEKVEQSRKVDEEATKAKEAIEAATDANGVDSSKGQGITNIDNQHQTQQPLEDRKEAAKAGIDDAANAAKDKIANDPTLTAEEKANQSAGVDQDAANAKSAIDAATDASGVDREKGQGITNIDNNYQPGTSLDSRKETAKAGIDEAAKEAKDKIANDLTLTDEEKATQSAGVDESAVKAKELINAVTDANGVDREKGQGITNIDNNYQPGTGLNIRKDLAKANIDEAAKATKEKINNDPTLTAEEKEKQSAGVDESAVKAKESIDAATDASGVDREKGQGITNIDNNYQPGNPLDSRKETAKAGIDAEAEAIKAKINNDSTLTNKEKEAQSKGVDDAATKAKEAIDAATDASGVDREKGQGITKIDKEYQPGSALDGRKEDAKKAIDDAAKATKAKINNDSTLTKAEKEKQSKGVDDAATEAKKAIDAAKNADGVDSAKGQGITNIDNNYQPGSALNGRKEDAKKAIDEEAKVVKEKINNDSTLTKAEKEKQSKGVDGAAAEAKKAIDTAKTADDVDAAKGQGIRNINKQYETGNVLDTRKNEAKKAIDDAAKATKEAIAKDTTLTEKEKEAQTKAVEAEAKKAKEAIDTAKTADGVDNAKGQGISEIAKQHESGKSIETQKEAAKKELGEAAEKTKEAINKDKSLTAKEKEAQIKAVEKALEEAIKAVDTAKNVDEVNSTKDNGTKEITKKHVPGKALETQKEEAKKELEKIAEKTKEAINKDTNLTAKEKEAQIKAVDDALEKAKEAIDKATDADAIAKIKVEAVTSVENQYKPGKKTSGGNGSIGTGSGSGKGTSSGGGYTSGTSGKTGYSALPKTGSESTGYLAGLVGFALSGLALLGFRKRRETEEE